MEQNCVWLKLTSACLISGMQHISQFFFPKRVSVHTPTLWSKVVIGVVRELWGEDSEPRRAAGSTEEHRKCFLCELGLGESGKGIPGRRTSMGKSREVRYAVCPTNAAADGHWVPELLAMNDWQGALGIDSEMHSKVFTSLQSIKKSWELSSDECFVVETLMGHQTGTGVPDHLPCLCLHCILPAPALLTNSF